MNLAQKVVTVAVNGDTAAQKLLVELVEAVKIVDLTEQQAAEVARVARQCMEECDLYLNELTCVK